MMLAYVASISIGVLDSGVEFSLNCAAKEREIFEGGGWRESERTFLTFLFHVSDPSFHPTCSTTKKSAKIQALPRVGPDHVDLTPNHNIKRPMPHFAYII